MYDPNKAGEALKLLLERLKNAPNSKPDDNKACKTYGCLQCKNYQKKEGYDQEWGRFGFFYYKCKKQPNRDMCNSESTHTIFDIEPDYSPNFHYEKAKGECPYFERGNNELIYMSDKEKEECIYG